MNRLPAVARPATWLTLLVALGLLLLPLVLIARPLPYPLDELWCVLLAPTSDAASNGVSRGSVVFVARHVDEYTGGWVVHQASGKLGKPELARALAKVGCDLPVGSPASDR